jgi:hypothetical protein
MIPLTTILSVAALYLELAADIRQADEAFRRSLVFRRALRQKRIQVVLAVNYP